MNNAKLKALVMSEYIDNPPKIKVDLNMYVSVGSELVLNASIKNPDYNNKYYGKLKNNKDTYYSNDYEDYEYLDVSYIGPVVSEAKSASITKESILKGISAMGDTNFVLGEAEINIDGNAFLPMGQVKQARREVLALLEEKIKNNHKRTYVKPEMLDMESLTKDMASNSEDKKLSLYFKDISLTKKLTNYSLINLINSLDKYSNLKLPQKISYALTKNIMKLQAEYSYYDKALNKLFEKYYDCFEKDEKGEVKTNSMGPIIKEDEKEAKEEYNKELVELLNVEVEIELFTIPSSYLDYDDSAKYDVLTAKDIMFLESLLCYEDKQS
jgi:hypothetical protein